MHIPSGSRETIAAMGPRSEVRVTSESRRWLSPGQSASVGEAAQTCLEQERQSSMRWPLQCDFEYLTLQQAAEEQKVACIIGTATAAPELARAESLAFCKAARRRVPAAPA